MKAELKQYDCIIIGGGVIGLSCALSLAKLNLSICVIEAKLIKRLNLDQIDNRVFALNHTSVNLFKHLNVWDKFARVSPFERMQVWDGAADGCVTFDQQNVVVEQLGFIIEGQVLSQALLDSVKAHNNITIKQEQKLKNVCTNTGVIQLDDNTTLCADFVIGADGANSLVREFAAIDLQAKSYNQNAIVATLRCEKPHQKTAYQCFWNNGPVALLPLKDEHLVSLVWSIDSQQVDELLKLPPEHFENILQAKSESALGYLKLESKRYSFPLKKQLAQHYWQGKSILLGDAAHVIHPLAGLGMNLGLMDVASLYDALSCYLKKGPYFRARIFNHYQRVRRSHAQLLQTTMDFFHYGFRSQKLPLIALRNWGLNKVDSTHQIKNLFIDFALGKKGYNIPYLGRSHHGSQSSQGSRASNCILQ